MYCRPWSCAGILRYVRFREAKAMESWECSTANANGWVALTRQTVLGKNRATVFDLVYLSRNMDDDSNCEAGTFNSESSWTYHGRTDIPSNLWDHIERKICQDEWADGHHHILIWHTEKGVTQKHSRWSGGKQMVVQLYRGFMKANTNQTNVLVGSSPMVERKDKAKHSS